MILTFALAIPAVLSMVLLLWQWRAGRCFPLHQRIRDTSLAPPVSLLKPLKGCDPASEDCLRSWFNQAYAGPVQILFGVAANDDTACAIVRKLIAEFPKCDSRLVVCERLTGANAKAAKLAELEKIAKHDVLVISDADVRVPPDLLANAVALLSTNPNSGDSRAADSQAIGLVNCFYRLANPSTLAMQWEAIAINADFWSQVLQSRTLKPLDFALGAVMVTRHDHLQAIGGFRALANCLADDYQLGNRLARRGAGIALCPVVVECWDPPTDWRGVWQHQLRWARTIRVCQPVPYFFSILSNPSLWPLVWALGSPSRWSLTFLAAALILRTIASIDLQFQLTKTRAHFRYAWLTPIKDLLNAAIWLGAFAGNRVQWRGQTYRLNRDGTLVKI